MLVVDRLALELVEEVEHDVRLPLLDGVTDGEDGVAYAEGTCLVPELAEGVEDVALRLDSVELRLGERLDVVGRHEILVHEREHPQLLAPRLLSAVRSVEFLLLPVLLVRRHRACQSLPR